MPDEVATVAEEVKTIPAPKIDTSVPLEGATPGMPLPGEAGSIYTRVGDISHGLPLVQVNETKLVVDQQAANDAVNNNAVDEDAVKEAEEREAKRQGIVRFAEKPDASKSSGSSTKVTKTETEPGVKGVQVPSR